jgi:hypothetical protein
MMVLAIVIARRLLVTAMTTTFIAHELLRALIAAAQRDDTIARNCLFVSAQIERS